VIAVRRYGLQTATWIGAKLNQDDTTITWMNSELLAQHVKGSGAPIEFVLYPGEKHGFGANTTTKHGADALRRTLVFLHQRLDHK
jgi:dipeptidyl aminopeptidase/acylaminoacyl peptidase